MRARQPNHNPVSLPFAIKIVGNKKSMNDQVITLTDDEWLSLRPLMLRLADFGWEPEVATITTMDEKRTFLIAGHPLPVESKDLASSPVEKEFMHLLEMQQKQ